MRQYNKNVSETIVKNKKGSFVTLRMPPVVELIAFPRLLWRVMVYLVKMQVHTGYHVNLVYYTLVMMWVIY